MLTREEVVKLALESKDRLGLKWPQVGEAIGQLLLCGISASR